MNEKIDRNIAESIILIEPWLLCSFRTHKKQSNINGSDQMYVAVIYIFWTSVQYGNQSERIMEAFFKKKHKDSKLC